MGWHWDDRLSAYVSPYGTVFDIRYADGTVLDDHLNTINFVASSYALSGPKGPALLFMSVVTLWAEMPIQIEGAHCSANPTSILDVRDLRRIQILNDSR